MNMNSGMVTIKVEKAIRVNANVAGSSISFAKAIELPARKVTQKFLMPFSPKLPFMWNPEMDFRSSLVYDLPIWPHAESIHVKLDPSVKEFKSELRIPTKNVVPIKDDEPIFQSNFPKPPLSYVFQEGQEIELVDEMPSIAHAQGPIISKAVHKLKKENEDIMSSLAPIPQSTVVSNKDFMDMRLIVQFPGKLPIFKDEEFPPLAETMPEKEEEEKITEKSNVTIAQKRVYKPDEVLMCRPLSIDKVEKLKTPGFIMLQNLSSVKTVAGFSTRRTGYSSVASLVEHEEDRFMTTGYRKKAGDFVDESVEAKTREATIKLNSLNPSNLSSTLKWFKSAIGPLLPMNTVIFLLLNRAALNTDTPEKNSQISLCALFAHYLCEDSLFHEKLVTQTNQRYESLVHNVQTKTILIQSFIVWISCILRETIISPYHFYRALELAILKQARPKAVEIVRTGLAAAGPYLLSKRSSESATFYRFVADHAHDCDGYVQFLVRELIENRTKLAQQQSQSFVAPTKTTIEQEQFDASALEEEISGQYYQTAPDEPFDPILPSNLPLKGVLSMMFKLLKKHARDIHDFVDYLGVIIKRLPNEKTEIRREVQILHPLYQQAVIEEDNSGLWGLAFVFYGELFNLGLFSFVEIIDFIRLIPKGGPQPHTDVIMNRFLQHAIIHEQDCISASQTDLLKDERALAIAISAVHFDSAISAETRSKDLDKEAKPSIVSCGFFCKQLVFDMFGTEDSQMKYNEIYKKSEKTFETIVKIYPEFCEIVIEAAHAQLRQDIIVTEFFDWVHRFIHDEQ